MSHELESVVEEVYEIQYYQPFRGWHFDRFTDQLGTTYTNLTQAAHSLLYHNESNNPDSQYSHCKPFLFSHEPNPLEFHNDDAEWLNKVYEHINCSEYSSIEVELNTISSQEWMWSHPWMLDYELFHGEWYYGASIHGMNKRLAEGINRCKKSIVDFLRRRRWIRTRIRKPSNHSFVRNFPFGKRFYNVYKDSHWHLRSQINRIEFDTHALQMEGWLGTRSHVSRSWRLRYFFLRSDTHSLICVRDRSHFFFVNEIPIDHHTSVLMEDSNLPTQHFFSILYGESKMRLNAITRASRAAWLEAISELIVRSRASFLAAEGSQSKQTLYTPDTFTPSYVQSSWRPYTLVCSSMSDTSAADSRFRANYLLAFSNLLEEHFGIARNFLTENFDILKRNTFALIEKFPFSFSGKAYENSKIELDTLEQFIQNELMHFELRVKTELSATHASVLMTNRIRRELYHELKRLNDLIVSFSLPADMVTERKKTITEQTPRIPLDWFHQDDHVHEEENDCQVLIPDETRSSEQKSPLIPYLSLPFVLSVGQLELPPGMNGYVIPISATDLGSLIAFAVCSKAYVSALEAQFGKCIDVCVDLMQEEKGLHVSMDAAIRRRHYACVLTSNNMQHADIEYSYFDTELYIKQNVRVIAYFAAQFHALRGLLSAGNFGFINSIAQSSAWEANGGKSGAFFSLTHDQRYVLKRISTTECNMFHHLAPQYFKYLEQAIRQNSRIIMSRIVGLYKLSRHHRHSKHTMYLVVMESTTYGFSPTQLYDLKGILRRKCHLMQSNDVETWKTVADCEKEEDENRKCVLLDGDFYENSPIPVRQEDLSAFEHAVRNDTSFLCRAGVIDYSILLMLYEKERVMVVGLIDYIHQFDLLKKMESTSKASLTFRDPTIVSPCAYQRRFQNAIHRYFVGIDGENLKSRKNGVSRTSTEVLFNKGRDGGMRASSMPTMSLKETIEAERAESDGDDGCV